MVREQTLKSVLTLITKLSDRTINGELLRYLAKTANDEQPGIRTNTTICLGKIAKYLGSSSRSKVLIAAFSRSLRDPFVHARNASLMALSVTSEYFSDEDCAHRIVPAICPSLIDKEKLIRDQASKAVDVYLAKIKKAAATMPETMLPPETSAAAAGGPRMSTPQPTESAAASWAGWAISSFTNTLSSAAGEIQSSSTPVNGAVAAPPSKHPATPSQTLSIPSTSNPPAALLNKERFSHEQPFHDANSDNADADDGADAWGDMDNMIEDDDDDATAGNNDASSAAELFATADPKLLSTTTSTTATLPKSSTKPSSTLTSATATPFDDGSEPDFAGWLAAQAQKKGGGSGKALPKGLSKSSGASNPSSGPAKKATISGGAGKTSKVLSAAPAKKKKAIDMKPKQADDEEDGWGGW